MRPAQYTMDDYVNAFRRRMPLFAWAAIPIILIAGGFAIGLQDYYRSAAEFRVDLEGPNLDVLEPIVLTNYADQYIHSLQQKALSRDNLETWLDRFDVYPGKANSTSRSNLIAEMRQSIYVTMVTTTVVQPGSGKPVDLITGFRVGFESADPATAQLVAADAAAEFLKVDRETRTARAATASSFLTEQIDASRREISELEGKLAEFKELNTTSLPEMMALNMSIVDRTERELEDVETQIRSLEEDRIFRQAQLQEIRQRSPAADQLAKLEQEYVRMVSAYGSDHPDLIKIKRQIAALTDGQSISSESAEVARLEAELAALQERYSDEHPDIIALKRRIETTRLENRDTMASMRGDSGEDPKFLQLRAQVNALDARLSSLRARARDLRQKLSETEDRLALTPQVEREYQALTRDLTTAQGTYRDLQEKLATARQTEALESGERGARLTLIQGAYVPDEPAGPPRMAILILGVFLAVSLGGMAAIFAEATDSTVRGGHDIVGTLETQPIVAIPVVQNSLSRADRRRHLLLYGGAFLIAIVGLLSLIKFPG